MFNIGRKTTRLAEIHDKAVFTGRPKIIVVSLVLKMSERSSKDIYANLPMSNISLKALAVLRPRPPIGLSPQNLSLKYATGETQAEGTIEEGGEELERSRRE